MGIRYTGLSETPEEYGKASLSILNVITSRHFIKIS